jgi:hypothetical protein
LDAIKAVFMTYTDRSKTKPSAYFGLCQLFADRTQQRLIGPGLFQNSPDAKPGRTSFDRRVGISCNHDRRRFAAALSKLGDELEPVQTWHLVVDDEAGDVWIVPEEIGATRICPHTKVKGLQQNTASSSTTATARPSVFFDAPNP